MDDKLDDKLQSDALTNKPTATDGDGRTETWNQSDRPAAPPPDDLPDIPGHEVIELVGRGGMGFVLKARHKVLDRVVAIKMPLPGHVADKSDLERFLREARATAKLRHANICPVYEVGEVGERPYITMAFIEGVTLARSIKQHRPSAREAAETAAVLARAVGYAHEHGVLHRDIKPGNVMVDAGSGQPVLMDFGLAKEFGFAKEIVQKDSQLTLAGQVMGTPAYMAPEQAAGQQDRIDTRSDVYSLGAMLYCLIGGQAPFSGSAGEVLRQVQSDQPPSLRNLAPRVHRDLETICLKALAKKPTDRYESAVAMAEDLERFCAGESILARREPLVSKAWRAVRRRPITVALLVVMIAALAVSSFYVIRDRQAAALRRSIQAIIESDCSSRADLDRAESLIERLHEFSQQRAEEQRQRLHQQFAASIERAIHQPRLQQTDIKHIDANLDLLAARDKPRAAALREKLKRRQSQWQSLFTLQQPFHNLESVLEADSVHVEPKGLTSQGHVVLTRLPSSASVRLEAEFDDVWPTADRLALMLGADTRQKEQDQGYVFRVEAIPMSDGDLQGAKQIPARVTLLRHDVPLREEQIHVPRGPLRLVAGREAGRLTFQVNQLVPIEFFDPFPISDTEARVLAIAWPESVALTMLRAGVRTEPPHPSPLERGDMMYARGELFDAMGEYEQQAIVSGTNEFGREARLKQGLCLLGLNRSADAAERFQRVADEDGARWPLVARCQLWAIRLDERKLDEAYAIFEGLASRYALEDLRPLIAADLTSSIIEPYRQRISGINWYLYNPELTRNIEQSLAVQNYFGVKGTSLELTKLYLCRAYHMAGDDRHAIQLARQLVNEQTSLQTSDEYRWMKLCELYSWLLRLQGDPQAALAAVDRQLFDSSGGYQRQNLALLIERARVHAALEDWEEAARDLDELTRLTEVGDLQYEHHSAACLVRGFLLERRGESAAAQEAWRQGSLRRTPEHGQLKIRRAEGLLHAMVLASLTDDFTAEDVEWLIDKASRRVADGHSIPLSVVKGVVRMSMLDLTPARLAGIVQRALDDPEGHVLARQLALRELSMDESARRFLGMMALHAAEELLVEGELSADLRDVFTQLAEGAYVAYYSGRLTNAQLLQLAPVWQGLTGLPGWKRVSASLDSSLRAGLAYALGLRYLRLNRPVEGRAFFRLALADAPPGSKLHGLIQTELNGVEDD